MINLLEYLGLSIKEKNDTGEHDDSINPSRNLNVCGDSEQDVEESKEQDVLTDCFKCGRKNVIVKTIDGVDICEVCVVEVELAKEGI